MHGESRCAAGEFLWSEPGGTRPLHIANKLSGADPQAASQISVYPRRRERSVECFQPIGYVTRSMSWW